MRYGPPAFFAAQIARGRLGKTMIADKEILAPVHPDAMEEEELMEKSSAPTVLDLRAALKELFADLDKVIEAERNSASPNDMPAQQPD